MGGWLKFLSVLAFERDGDRNGSLKVQDECNTFGAYLDEYDGDDDGQFEDAGENDDLS